MTQRLFDGSAVLIRGVPVIHYSLPVIKLDHLKKMTSGIGVIQFSKIKQPDPGSGYTLDDNARALIACCMYYKLTQDQDTTNLILLYFSFLKKCQQPAGNFLNFFDKDGQFTDQNKTTSLDDANGRAVWALGYLISLKNQLPREIITQAVRILNKCQNYIGMLHSTRAMAYAIKGLYYSYGSTRSPEYLALVIKFANRLVQMYKPESAEKREWFESSLTYANSLLPEAMLYAWLLTGEMTYRDIAKTSLNFLMSQTFNENGYEVISIKNWNYKGQEAGHFGEQPVEIADTIMTLSKFYDELKDDDYRIKLQTAFNWFLGKNRLHQTIYDPGTGGCRDGLEESHVILNQGAESTISYLMARLTIEKYKNNSKKINI